jgi:hypothetical protein
MSDSDLAAAYLKYVLKDPSGENYKITDVSGGNATV